MNKTCILTVSLALFQLLMVKGAAAGTLSFERKFNSNELHLSEINVQGSLYHKVSIGTSEYMELKPGSPEIPVYYISLVLPPGATGIKLHVTGASEDTVGGKYMICPAQPLTGLAGPDPVLYGQKFPFPNRAAEIRQIKSANSGTIVKIALFPVQYWPGDSSLTILSSISYQVEYDDVIVSNGVGRDHKTAGQTAFPDHRMNITSLDGLK